MQEAYKLRNGEAKLKTRVLSVANSVIVQNTEKNEILKKAPNQTKTVLTNGKI